MQIKKSEGRIMKIYGKEEIQALIPHRGRMILLDRVCVDSGLLVGEFLITGNLCEGHAVFKDEELFRGSDVYDIAGQLLGVWIALQDLKLIKGISVIRRYGEAVFKERIVPGEILQIELLVANIETSRMREFGWRIIGRNFVAKVNGTIKNKISFVEIFIA